MDAGADPRRGHQCDIRTEKRDQERQGNHVGLQRKRHDVARIHDRPLARCTARVSPVDFMCRLEYPR
ncbi:Uncharacterised protein [Bordetella pertussis]|nr:Uncharacterised protein [Bordetella pertussis]